MSNPPQSVELLLNEQERIEDDIAPLSDDRALRRRVTRQIKKRREFRSHLLIFVAMNLMFLVFFAALGIPWVAGIIALSWGSGVAAQAVDLYFDTGERAAKRLARMHQAYRDAYGPRWHEKARREDLIRIRRDVDGPVQKRSEFYAHLAVFTCINLMLWFLYLTLMAGSFPWPLLVTGFWGLGVVGHANEVLFSRPRTDKAIEREVERQRQMLADAEWEGEKPKNDFREDEPAMTVGPDGELIELTELTDPEDEKRKRAR